MARGRHKGLVIKGSHKMGGKKGRKRGRKGGRKRGRK